MVKCSYKNCVYKKEDECTCENVLKNYEKKAFALISTCSDFVVLEESLKDTKKRN